MFDESVVKIFLELQLLCTKRNYT